MNNFVEGTENFVQKVNMSLIERSQIIDSLEILLEKVENFPIPKEHGANKEQLKAQSLLEVLLISLKDNQATDEDTTRIFEIDYLDSAKKEIGKREVNG